MGFTCFTQGWTHWHAWLRPQSSAETIVGCRDVHPNSRLTHVTEMRGTKVCTTKKCGGYIFHWFITNLGKHVCFWLLKRKFLWLSLATQTWQAPVWWCWDTLLEEGPPKRLPELRMPQYLLEWLAVRSRWKAPFITSPIILWLDQTWPPRLWSNLIPALDLWLPDRVLYAVLMLIKQITTCQ